MARNLPILLFSFLFISPLAVFAGHFSPDSVLSSLAEEAVRNNPKLKMFQEQVEIFREKPPQARSLDNPRLRLGIMNLPDDTFRFDQEPMTQKQVSIMQKFPFPGKLQLREDIAQKDVDIVKAEYHEQKNDIILQVKTAYLDLLFLNKALEVTEENRTLLRKFIKIAETKYAVGKGIQQDVIKAQVELSRMTDLLISLEQKKHTTTARINTLLNRPVQSPFTVTEDIEQTSFNVPFEDLIRLAEENHPLLLKLRHLVEKTRFSKELSEKNVYPDIDVGVSYGQRDDGPSQERADFLSGFVTVNIPLWYKTKESRSVAEEEAKIKKTLEEYNAFRNDVHFQIKRILIDIEKDDKEIELFRSGLIPQGRLSLESALSGYKVNKIDFISLVNNQITLYNYELDYYRSLTDHETKLAELEKALGLNLYSIFSTTDARRK